MKKSKGVKERRASVKKRLEKQLVEGTKNVYNNGIITKVPLTQGDIKRIKAEISTISKSI